MKRSVGRVDGVEMVEFDLNGGQARVWAAEGTTVERASLWEAVKKAGFTPVEIRSDSGLYRGP